MKKLLCLLILMLLMLISVSAFAEKDVSCSFCSLRCPDSFSVVSEDQLTLSGDFSLVIRVQNLGQDISAEQFFASCNDAFIAGEQGALTGAEFTVSRLSEIGRYTFVENSFTYNGIRYTQFLLPVGSNVFIFTTDASSGSSTLQSILKSFVPAN